MKIDIDSLSLDVTEDEANLVGDASRLGGLIYEKSKSLVFNNTDPKIFSIAIYSRLWGNYNSYILLWNNNFLLEADILLRSAVESTICIAALRKLGGDFVTLMRQDAAHTIQGQIKIFRSMGDKELVADAEEQLRRTVAKLPTNMKPAKLNWSELAEIGGVPHMYDDHRRLSGLYSHVTGFSILNHLNAEGSGDRDQLCLNKLNQKMSLMNMLGTMLVASLFHAGTLEEEQLVIMANKLLDRLNAISFSWPGVPMPENEFSGREK